MPIANLGPIKPGYKTTEFWLTMGSNVAAILTTLAGVVPPKWSAIFLIAANGLYALSRGLAKQ